MAEQRTNNTSLILRIVSDIEKKLDDFEARIRELERARWSAAFLQALLTAAVTAGVVAAVLKGI